jgi:hypothetical protein
VHYGRLQPKAGVIVLVNFDHSKKKMLREYAEAEKEFKKFECEGKYLLEDTSLKHLACVCVLASETRFAFKNRDYKVIAQFYLYILVIDWFASYLWKVLHSSLNQC